MNQAPRLSRWPRRIVRALAEAVMPEAASGAPAVETEQLVVFVERLVPKMPRLLGALFPLGLVILELGGLLFAPALAPLSWMPLAKRRRYLHRWLHSRSMLRRDLVKGLKGLCLLAYYSDERVQRYLGYQPVEHVELVKADRLRRYGNQL